MKEIHIIGGGTVSHVRNHLALTAPAYGKTARKLDSLLKDKYDYAGWYANMREYGSCSKDIPAIHMHLTKMASGGEGNLETNKDIEKLVDELVANPKVGVIFFNAALVDYDGSVATSGPVGYEWADDIATTSGKYEERLKTSEGKRSLLLTPAAKLIGKIRKERKDIFLVGFKTTCGAETDAQFLTGLHLLKSASCNLVLANDTKTRTNMIITPEQARYSVTTDRDLALKELVNMTAARSQGTFTRSKVVTGRGVPWTHDLVPASLRTVVDHCIKGGAYKPFNGATVGHFAVKLKDDKFLTSMRKSNFNQLEELALVHAVGNDEVWSQGGKPSVGGQSQRIVFKDHPEMDCIVHFHCPPRKHDTSNVVQHNLSIRSQKDFECGSHECGQNTSSGLREEVPGIKCVYLDNHGPNIVFNRNIDPEKVISFIERNFDLSQSTDQVNRTI